MAVVESSVSVADVGRLVAWSMCGLVFVFVFKFFVYFYSVENIVSWLAGLICFCGWNPHQNTSVASTSHLRINTHHSTCKRMLTSAIAMMAHTLTSTGQWAYQRPLFGIHEETFKRTLLSCGKLWRRSNGGCLLMLHRSRLSACAFLEGFKKQSLGSG